MGKPRMIIQIILERIIVLSFRKKLVWFLRRFGLKTVIDFAHFSLKSGIVFERDTRWCMNIFIDWFRMNKK